MTPKIEEGSVVELKSGGPWMTIEELTPTSARVVWYDEERRDVQRANIGLPALQLVEL